MQWQNQQKFTKSAQKYTVIVVVYEIKVKYQINETTATCENST